MPGVTTGFHVTGNIKVIERLKCQLLANVSDLHQNLLKPGGSLSERGEILAEIVVAAYALSERLGIPYAALDEHILNKLKLRALDDEHALDAYAAQLLKHRADVELNGR